MKLSEINGGTPQVFNPSTDKLVGVRTVDGVASDQLFDLPPLTSYGPNNVYAVESAAGVGATISGQGINAGLITITTGTGTGIGNLFSITYPQAFPNGSSGILQASNAAALSLMSHLYIVANATGANIMINGGIADVTIYEFNYLIVGN